MTRSLVIVSAMALAAVGRLVPHPANMAPLTAIALFAGAVISDRLLALLACALTVFATDLCQQLLYRGGVVPLPGFYQGMWTVYLTYLVIAVLGFVLRRRKSLAAVASMTVASSLVFFLLTNFAVWASGGLDAFSRPYERSLTGLVTCYVEALPFLHSKVPPLGFLGNGIVSDAFYSTFLFGSLALAERWVPGVRPAPRVQPSGPVD
jgi:hypothetical protein